MSNGASFDAIWAQSPIIGGTVQSHQANTLQRGNFFMNLPVLRKAGNILQTISIALLSALAILLLAW